MRSDVIDIIKAISIIMIVNVHLLSGEFFNIGCTYHVIAFFFAAGLIHGLNEKWRSSSLVEFCKRKTKSLLYPYITLSICYILMHLILNIVRGDIIFNVVITDSLIKTICLRGIGTLWFLPVLFFAELLFFIFRRTRIILLIILGLSAIVIASQLNSSGFFLCNELTIKVLLTRYPPLILLASIIATLFICLGYIVCKLMPKLFVNTVDLEKKTMALVITVCLSSILVDYGFVSNYSGDLHKLTVGNIWIYLACSLSGIAFVSSLSIVILRYCRHISKVLLNWGRNSLIIMTTHTEYYINSIAYVLVTGIAGALHTSLDNKIVSLLSLSFIMIIESILIAIINKTKLKYLYSLPSINLNR